MNDTKPSATQAAKVQNIQAYPEWTKKVRSDLSTVGFTQVQIDMLFKYFYFVGPHGGQM
jgi:hypothetical protein